MLLPQIWERVRQWLESTTTWYEARNRELTHVYLAGYRAGNPASSQHAIGGYLAALEGKSRELARLNDQTAQAFDDLARERALRPDEYLAQHLLEEKQAVLALFNQVAQELGEQTEDWRRELQAASAPQAAKPASPTLIDSLLSFLTAPFKPQTGRALSFGFRVPKLTLRRRRKRANGTRKKD